MGKNFKEFWKRQIAKLLAISMTLSTLCSAGVPIVHAADDLGQEVDGRIISEAIMQKVAEGGTWEDSFELTAEVLTEIFGTTMATLDSDSTKAIDLAKDIHEYSAAEEAVLADIDDIIDSSNYALVKIAGNGKWAELRIVGCYLPTLSDNPTINQVPVEVDGKLYSDKVAGYLGVEGALVNREGVLGIGLGKHASAADLQARYKNTYTVETHEVADATNLGASYNLTMTNGTYKISNLPHLVSNEYTDVDPTPVLIIVPRSPIPKAKTVVVQDVSNTASPVVVNATVDYRTESGKYYTAGSNTTERVTATATLPFGYDWAPGEDGVAEFDYWDTIAYINLVPVSYNTNFTVVDEYDSSIILPYAVLSVQQKFGDSWQHVGDLNDWQLTPALINTIRAAANTFGYEFRIVNRVAHPGYAVDDDYKLLDARYTNNLEKTFQEVARHIIHIQNVAADGTPMAGAKYTITYGDFTEEITLDSEGKATSSVFLDSGLETVTITRDTAVDGYIPQEANQRRTVRLDDMLYDAGNNAFAATIVDEDALYIPPDYNHHVQIHVQDETNTPVENVRFGIFIDDTCTIPARTEADAAITDAELTSNLSGDIIIPEIPAGTYYIKLDRSTTGYTDVLFNPATTNNVEIFTVIVDDDDTATSLNVGIRRQVGDITFTVVDENGAPVTGAVYELRTVYLNPDSYAGATIPGGTTVGRYTTDENGVIHITKMNQAPWNNHVLINGQYALLLFSTPVGYKTSAESSHTIYLNWSEHDDIVYADAQAIINNVTYTTNFTVVDKNNPTLVLDEAVLSLQQKFGDAWQHIGHLNAWQLTPELINIIRETATTFNYEFRIVNSTPQKGYVVDNSAVELDAREDNNLNKRFEETSKHVVHIANIANNGTPMAGAKYTLTYGDYTEEIVLGADGTATSTVFLHTGETTLTLTRDTEVENYTSDAGHKTRTINLSLMTYNSTDNAFAYSFVDQDTYIPPDYNHYVNINVVDNFNLPVEDVTIGIYTNAQCTEPAKTEEGLAIDPTALMSDDMGCIELPEIPAGTYYIKLEKSIDGYSDTLFDPATDTVTAVFSFDVVDDNNTATLNIGIERQVGDITFTVTDDHGEPVVGAVYELKTVDIIPNNYAGSAIAADVLVGQYTTDDNGVIHITNMNRAPYNGSKLANGTYKLVFVSAPAGYKTPDAIDFNIDLNWVEHEDIVYATNRATIKNVTYTTDVTVVDKYNPSKTLNEAVLSAQQKFGDSWQHIGNLEAWQLTPALIDIIRAAATTFNYEFRIVNRTAHPGYTIDDTDVQFDARDDANIVKDFQEVSKHIIHITNIADDGTAMEGATYTLTYGNITEEITLDANGTASSAIFLHSDEATLTLTRNDAVEGYEPQAENATRVINLADMTYDEDNDAFAYSFTDEDAYIPPDYNHFINIHVQDEHNAGVKNVQLGIYTDAECTIPALTELGVAIGVDELTTDDNGDIVIPEVVAGTYYIKLARSTNGYSDILFDPADSTVVEIFTVEVVDDDNTAKVDIGIKRQVGDITLTVTDENGEPVVGAVYELKTVAINPDNYAGTTFNSDTTVARYTTDDNGVIHITKMNLAPVNGFNLVNGTYKFVFVSAPVGYNPPANTEVAVDLTWAEHEDIVYDAVHATINNVTYTTNFTVVDKNDNTIILAEAVLSLQQNFGGTWQHVGDLVNWELTPAQIATIRESASTFNYEFRIVNRTAHAGYAVATETVLLDARKDNNLTFKFQEATRHIIHIENFAEDNTPMAGAKYTLTYGDYTEEIILGADGTAHSAVFVNSGVETLTLTRDTQVGDYVPQEENRTRTLNLSDMTYNEDDNAFVYTFADKDTNPDYDHHINIHVVDDENDDVANVQLGIFTDAECTVPAKTENGLDIEDDILTTNAEGRIALPEVPVGTYYIKLMRSTKGYSDRLFNPATSDNTEIFTVTVVDDFNTASVDVGIRRQTGDITLTVLDENGAPVAGATYELKTVDIQPTTYAGITVPNGIVVGEYTTDENGVINIVSMNRGPLSGYDIVNGSYELSFISSPEGYKLSNNTLFEIDLGWVEHEDVVYETKYDQINRYITYTVNVDIVDAQLDNDLIYSMYSDESDIAFKDAYADSILPNVAYLIKGKDITMTVSNVDPIEVMIDRNLVTIPADTVLLTHELDSLSFSFDSFFFKPEGSEDFIEIGVPMGTYRFHMDESGIGYEWVQDDAEVGLYDEENRELNVTLREQVILTDLSLTKTDANYGRPISGITFALVNVDVLSLHGLDTTDTTLNNKTITEFLNDNDIVPIYTATSNNDGKVDFGKIPYGTYWLIETYDAMSEKFEITRPIVVKAIGGEIDANVTNVSLASYIRVKHMDRNTNAPIANAEFSLYNANVVQGSGTTDENGHFVSLSDYINGEFVISNIRNAGGYLLADDVVVTAINGAWTMETDNGTIPLPRVWDTTAEKWIVEIPVYAETNELTIYASFEEALLPNVVFTIYDENHTVIDTIESENGMAVINGIPAGPYYITQSSRPGFVTLPEQTLLVDNETKEYKVVFENHKTLVGVKTLDAIGGWELDGVAVEMYQGTTLIATFNDINSVHSGIPAGDYVLKTTQMPEGYQAPSADIHITVLDTAEEQIFINNVIDVNSPDGGPVVYEDNRTYGTFDLIKKDSFDGHPLAGVEFSFQYAEDVTINGVPFKAGTEIEKLTTDKDGKAALQTPVVIGVYTEEGVTLISYALVETKLPAGQYVAGDASIPLNDIKFEYVDDKTEIVTKPTIEIGNNRPNIVVKATSDPETRLYDENGYVTGFEYLTVLQQGQEVTYTIEVENNGNATGYDIDVRDILPDEFVITNAETGTFTVEKGVVYWHISEIAPGETVQLVLKAKVDSTGAVLLNNRVEWHMPDTPYAPGEGVDKEDDSVEWNKLPVSQYQVIVFSSAASQDRIIMSAFDSLTLHYTFSAADELTDFRFTDVIPEGLTYVEGSAQLNGEPYSEVIFDEETRVLEFITPDEWSNNMRFTFTMQVDYMQSGSENEWETHASITFLENAYTMKELTLMTDTITIVADAQIDVEYTTDIETFVGTPDEAEDITVLKKDDYVIYTAYIYNNGVSKLKNVMLKDILPEGMTFEPVDDNDKRTAIYMDGKEIVWFAASINPGEVLEFSVKATVKDQKAALIENYVTYDVMKENVVNGNGQMIKVLEFQNTARDTDSALYQVLEFHKAAEVLGKNVTDGNVAIGDTLVYTMSVTAADLVNGIEITDKIPAGVTFVPGSAQIKLAGENNWTDIKDALVYDKTSKTVKFATDADATSMITVGAGVNYFRFSVTVDRIGTNNANANNYNKATFTNTATLDYWANPFDEDSVETLTSEAVSHMTEISVTGEKSGSVDTYEGAYADRKYVTVVKEGDELVFKIAVKNAGANALTNVVIEDVVPENSTLVTKDGDTYTHKDGVLTWIIPEIKANETAEVNFTVKVTPPADKAVEIVNKAKYAVPADINNIKSSEWIETNSVVYQVIRITMSSSVPGGVDATDAKTVEIGSTITYTITVENVDDIYGLNLSNKIPEGMEFVEDSAKVKIGDGEATAAKFTLDNNLIKFNQFDEVKAGKMEVSFSVKVKDTAEYDKDVIFINQAQVTLKPAKDAEKEITMQTNPISHTAKKTNATDTPKLGLETTNASLVWGLITIIALAGIGVFGYFGFIEPNKKRRK